MPLLTVVVSQGSNGVVNILPSGSIDSDTYEILEKDVDDALKLAPKTLIFDMKDLKYISSMGIRTLLSARNKVEKYGGALLLTNLQPQIIKVFDIVRAIPSHNIFANREELDRYLVAVQQREIDKRTRS